MAVAWSAESLRPRPDASGNSQPDRGGSDNPAMTRSPCLDAAAPTLQSASALHPDAPPPSPPLEKCPALAEAPPCDISEGRAPPTRGPRGAALAAALATPGRAPKRALSEPAEDARPSKATRVYSREDQAFIMRLGSLREWGGQLAACALARRYGRPIRIWRQSDPYVWTSEVGHYCPSGAPGGGATVHLRYDGSHYQWVDARQAPAADAPGGGFALVNPPYTDAGGRGDCLFLALAYGINFRGYGNLLRAYAAGDDAQVRRRAVGLGVEPALASTARLSSVLRRCRDRVAAHMRQDLVDELRAHPDRYADGVAAARVERRIDARDRRRAGLRSAVGDWPVALLDGLGADLASLFG